jgi:hypothetical protein
MSKSQYRPSALAARRSQQGYGIVSALLALVIGAVVALGQIEGVRVERQTRSGALQGELLNLVKTAYNDYAMENYPALQNDLAVTKNGVTLPAGTAFGQSMAPRVQDLVSMGYLSPGTTDQAFLVDGGVYRGIFRREPASCVGVACNIPGMLYIDQPVHIRGTVEMNGLAVGSLIEKVGGDALVSLNTNPTQLIAINGANVANPLTGNPVGVVGARIGFGASGFGRFLVMNDPRDPNFQGNVTIAGAITSSSVSANSIGAGTGDTGCRLGEIIASGEILSRSSACIRRAWIDGGSGQVGVADSAGLTRVLLDGSSGTITTRDSTGAVRAGFSFDGAASVASADLIRNNANTAGFRADGTVFGEQFVNNSNNAGVLSSGVVFGTSGDFSTIKINSTATIGGACTDVGAAVWGTLGGAPVLLKCQGGAWASANGTTVATVGTVCITPDQQAVTASGVGLICEGGQWMNMADRMGKFSVAETRIVSHGSVLAKPACGSGGLPRIYAVPQAIDSSQLYTNFLASDNGSTWTATITDNAGNPLLGRAIAQTGCFYL